MVAGPAGRIQAGVGGAGVAGGVAVGGLVQAPEALHEQVRGVRDGESVRLSSRVGATVLRARIADRMPVGVVYTTFHHPVTGANVVTTEHSDWATNCPEYKVTAVQVEPAVHLASSEAAGTFVPHSRAGASEPAPVAGD